MKKILLFLVLAVTFNLSAQISTTYFAKPLELNSVPASTTKADSVIVRGADKILKFVPRSEFVPEVIPQNLQKTLDNGSITTTPIQFDSGTDQIILDGIGFSAYGAASNFNFLKETQSWYNNSITRRNTLYFNRLTDGDASYRFPEKPTGEYIFATLNDIPTFNFQNVYDGGNIFYGSGSIQFVDIYNSNSISGWSPNAFSVLDGATDSRLQFQSHGITWHNNLEGIQVGLDFRRVVSPGGNVSFKLPQVSTGAYTLPVSVNGEFADVNGNITLSGSGGSLTLDQVLENGDTATGGKTLILTDGGTRSNALSAQTMIIRDNDGSNYLTTSYLNFYKPAFTRYSLSLDAFNSEISYRGDLTNDAITSRLSFTGQGNFNLPTKTIGSNYTLATLDDIINTPQNLQELLDEGSTASNIDTLRITGSNGVINIDNSGLTLWAPKMNFNGEINQSTTNFAGIPKISQVIEFYNDYPAIQNGDLRTGLIYSRSNGFYFGDSNGMYISSNNDSDTGYINFEGGGNGRLNLGKQHSTLTAVSSSPFYIQNTSGGIDLNAGSYGGLSMNSSGVQLQNRGNTSPLIIQSDKTLITGVASLGEFTVENLPTPSNTAYATVLDATSPAYLTPVVGGGNVTCPVFYNGTAWVAH